MATASPIYTRAGDGGRTRLGSGALVPKTDPRVEAYGTVDELNALVGLVLASGLPDQQAAVLSRIQHDLFAVGADLCNPPGPAGCGRQGPRVGDTQVERLEREIDCLNSRLPPLRHFVLPGGRGAGGWLHLARTVCRRAERRVWALGAEAGADRQVAVYLNRLSDLLFVLARVVNQGGAGELLWKPEGSRDGS